MFCVIFGLSMDYEVLFLSRIQGATDRRQHGRRRQGRCSEQPRDRPAPPLIIVDVFSAFVLADEVTVVGVGMAIAVAIEHDIVRVLLVPAVMRLLGRCWIGPLGRIADRVGFSHVEADDLRPAADGAPRERGAAGVAGPDGSLAESRDGAVGCARAGRDRPRTDRRRPRPAFPAPSATSLTRPAGGSRSTTRRTNPAERPTTNEQAAPPRGGLVASGQAEAGRLGLWIGIGLLAISIYTWCSSSSSPPHGSLALAGGVLSWVATGRAGARLGAQRRAQVVIGRVRYSGSPPRSSGCAPSAGARSVPAWAPPGPRGASHASGPRLGWQAWLARSSSMSGAAGCPRRRDPGLPVARRPAGAPGSCVLAGVGASRGAGGRPRTPKSGHQARFSRRTGRHGGRRHRDPVGDRHELVVTDDERRAEDRVAVEINRRSRCRFPSRPGPRAGRRGPAPPPDAPPGEKRGASIDPRRPRGQQGRPPRGPVRVVREALCEQPQQPLALRRRTGHQLLVAEGSGGPRARPLRRSSNGPAIRGRSRSR